MRPAPSAIRAWRQSLLWLLRSLYLGRLGLCYLVMTRGRHAAPDMVHGAMTVSLFVDLLIFLVAFFEYFPSGRRAVLVECGLRPVALVALVAVGLVWAPRPAISLGWGRGAGPIIVLGVEFVLAPLATWLLVRAIGTPSGTHRFRI